MPVRDKRLKRYPGAEWGWADLADLAKVTFLKIPDFMIPLLSLNPRLPVAFHSLFMPSLGYYGVLEFQGTNQEEGHMEKWKKQIIISKEKVGLVSFLCLSGKLSS